MIYAPCQSQRWQLQTAVPVRRTAMLCRCKHSDWTALSDLLTLGGGQTVDRITKLSQSLTPLTPAAKLWGTRGLEPPIVRRVTTVHRYSYAERVVFAWPNMHKRHTDISKLNLENFMGAWPQTHILALGFNTPILTPRSPLQQWNRRLSVCLSV